MIVKKCFVQLFLQTLIVNYLILPCWFKKRMTMWNISLIWSERYMNDQYLKPSFMRTQTNFINEDVWFGQRMLILINLLKYYFSVPGWNQGRLHGGCQYCVAIMMSSFSLTMTGLMRKRLIYQFWRQWNPNQFMNKRYTRNISGN